MMTSSSQAFWRKSFQSKSVCEMTLCCSLMTVFLEQDLLNADMENSKIKQLEDIMSHLTHRVSNSKGGVKAPATKLLDILNDPRYTGFQNQTVKRHVTERIH